MQPSTPIVKISPQMWGFEKAPFNRCPATTRMNPATFGGEFSQSLENRLPAKYQAVGENSPPNVAIFYNCYYNQS
jgi:hypothetical protein